MNKLVQIQKEDILFDPEAIGEMLTECLKRKTVCTLAGACETDSCLIVSFEPAEVRCKGKIVIAPLEGLGPDELCSSIASRYTSGFSLRCSFHAGDKLWALFLYERQKA